MTDELVLPYLKSILNEEQVVTDYTNDGVEFKRKPKSHEKRWAADQLMKISLGSTSQVDITTQGEKIGAIDDIGRRAILAAADEIQQSE
jgi:isopentenyl phosphate kinase